MLVLGYLGWALAPQVGAAIGAGDGGRPAPAFQLTTLTGDTVSLESLRGKVVLVNFWATWCPPCRVEMPGFQRVYEDRADDGLVILAVSTERGQTELVERYVSDREVTFPVAMATAGLVRAFGEPRKLPTSFLIDRHGRIRHEVTGLFAEPALRLAVDRLLEEEAQAGQPEGP